MHELRERPTTVKVRRLVCIKTTFNYNNSSIDYKTLVLAAEVGDNRTNAENKITHTDEWI